MSAQKPKSKSQPETPVRHVPAKPTSKSTSAKGKANKPAPLGPPAWRIWIEEALLFLYRYRREITALLLIVVGALTLVAGIVAPPSWAQVLFGWTGPIVAAVLTGIGAYLLVGRRMGYWSAEALIGFELLLLALQAGTFVWQKGAPITLQSGALPRDGSLGGIVGAAIGSLLVGGFGRTLTILLLVVTGLAGFLLLVRYTPLIFGAARLAWLAPAWYMAGQRLWARLPIHRRAAPMLDQTIAPASPNFVSPYADEAGVAEESVPAPRTQDRLILPEPSPTESASVQPQPKPSRVRKPPAPEVVTSGPPVEGGVNLPPIDLLQRDSGAYTAMNLEGLQRRIETTLEDFEVPVKVVHVESGPTVTQFGVEPLFVERAGQKRKVRVSRIVSLADDLALALAAPAVRIEAPVPGRPYVGIEVPNEVKAIVSVRGIMESAELRRDGGPLALPLGRNTSGAPVALDLSRAPHMLIAGSTGSGKSVCINTIVTGLLMRHAPDTLRFVMVDPKRVELTGYNGIPHLMGNVITDVDMVMPALTWLLVQMDDRYRMFREVGVRNVDSYNALVRKENAAAVEKAAKNGTKDATATDVPQKQTLPYIVLIVDELADLMMTAPEDIERQLCRLAQMARATGIHLILATQRPSVDVVTGLIKANFPTRIAFAVTSSTDSRVILDGPGAERLLGRGDMLVMKPDLAKLLRVQGCLVTDDEIGGVVNFWKKQPQAQERPARAPWADLVGRDEESDDLLERAITLLTGQESCTTSFLQRKLRIGFPRAARLMDQLEEMGAVGPDQGSGQGRAVLIREDTEPENPDNVIEWTGAVPSAVAEIEDLPPFLRN